jgi:hypothetical protein
MPAADPTNDPFAIDKNLASVIDAKTLAHDASDGDSDSDIDALLEDSDPVLAAHRAARVAALNKSLAEAKTARQAPPVRTFTTERNVMDAVANAPRALIHFTHPDFPLCGVLDKALEEVGRAHFEVVVGRADVSSGSMDWLVGKLGVRVLPCLVGWQNGVECWRGLGFEGFAKSDGKRVDMAALERVLVDGGVLVRVKGMGDGEGAESEEERESRRRDDEADAADEDDWD